MKLPLRNAVQSLFGRKEQAHAADKSDAQPRLRMGVVGPGLIWRHKHRIEMERHQNRVEIVALCARSENTLATAGVSGARQYTAISDLLQDADVDAVMVLTPIALNASTAIAALNARKDVFVEKPLGRSVEECKAVLRAEAESGKKLHVLEQAVYSPWLLTMQRLVTEKRIGDLILYDRIHHFLFDADAHDVGGYGRTKWRQQCDFPLGLLFDAGVHEIAQLTRLFGIPEHVAATGRKWRKDYGAYDEVLMQFAYSSGLRGIFSHSAALPRMYCGFNIRGTKGVISLAGANVMIGGLDGEPKEVPLENGNSDMWNQILAAHETGAPSFYTSVEAAQDVAILEAVAKAVDSGVEQEVERITA